MIVILSKFTPKPRKNPGTWTSKNIMEPKVMGGLVQMTFLFKFGVFSFKPSILNGLPCINHQHTTSWWFQPSWKIWVASHLNWIISPGRGEQKKYLKPPLRPHFTTPGLPPHDSWINHQPPLQIQGFRLPDHQLEFQTPKKYSNVKKNVEIEEYIKLIQIEFPKLNQLTKTIRTSIIHNNIWCVCFVFLGWMIWFFTTPVLTLHLTPPR